MTRAIIIIALFFLLAGCSQTEDTEPLPDEVRELENVTVYPADTQPEFDIQLSKERAFPGSEEVLIGKILGVEADRNGNIYIADGEQTTIHVFGTAGSHKTQIGRPGRGPGEFGGLLLGKTMLIDANRLYVHDVRYFRINIFSTETFEHVSIIDLGQTQDSNIDELKSSSGVLYKIINNELFVMGFTDISKIINYPETGGDIYGRFYLVNNKGEITGNKIFEFPLPRSHRAGDLSRGTLVVVSARQKKLFTAWIGSFLVKVYDLEGNYRRAFYHPYENIEPEPADIPDVEVGVEVPDTWPALESMLIDDQNRLWISTIVEDEEIYEWWVLEDTGELLARFDWPKDKEIKTVKNGKLYTLETEEETGLEDIVRYNISMEPWD